MAYASKAQQAKFHSDPALQQYAPQWDAATKKAPGGFKGLPDRVKPKPKPGHKAPAHKKAAKKMAPKPMPMTMTPVGQGQQIAKAGMAGGNSAAKPNPFKKGRQIAKAGLKGLEPKVEGPKHEGTEGPRMAALEKLQMRAAGRKS